MYVDVDTSIYTSTYVYVYVYISTSTHTRTYTHQAHGAVGSLLLDHDLAGGLRHLEKALGLDPHSKIAQKNIGDALARKQVRVAFTHKHKDVRQCALPFSRATCCVLCVGCVVWCEVYVLGCV